MDLKNTYLVHGTNLDAIRGMLTDPYPKLKVKPGVRHFETWDDHFCGIFLNLLCPGIPESHRLDPNWFSVAIVLNIDLLDQLCYTATPIGEFDSVNPKVLSRGWGYGRGDLEPIKQNIVENITFRKGESQSYIYSHEIVVSENINLQKYLEKFVVFIGVSTSEQDSLRELASRHHMKITFANSSLKRINHLLDIISGTIDPEERIENPKTKRLVLKYGQTGKKITKQASSRK